MKYLIILTFIIASFQTSSQESKVLRKTDDTKYCIDSSEFKIGSLSLGLEMSDVIELVGQSDSIEVDNGMIDSLIIHYYKGLTIYYLDNMAFGIVTSSDTCQTPSGIHTGLSIDKVTGILGIKQYDSIYDKHKIELFGCHDDNSMIEFGFDETHILREIIIAIDFF